MAGFPGNPADGGFGLYLIPGLVAGGAKVGLSQTVHWAAARSLTPIPVARSLAPKRGGGTLRPNWGVGGQLRCGGTTRDRNAQSRRLTTTLTHAESLEPRAMLAGVEPETWSSAGLVTAPQVTGDLSGIFRPAESF